MTFQPVLPASGNLGWTILQKTREAQQNAFDESALIARETQYFSEEIGSVTSAEDLVSDRRLLSVALGAFGLDDDINNTFFIRKVLEEGTLDPEAFSNRLADKRYAAMSEAFGFELSPPKSVLSTFAEPIIEQYKTRQFEVAVGNQDSNMRLALGIERDLADLAERELSEDAQWFTVMGTPAMRAVFEKALGFPSAIAAVDIDQQLEVFRDKSERLFGVTSPAEFIDPELQENLVRNFLFRADLETSAAGTASASVALSLLQSQTPLF